ncbi:MAG: hypothetical protein ABMA02_19900, partial [Saprospiraceae bacterium]
LSLLLAPIAGAFGQTQTDSIEVKKAFGTVFRYKGKNLSPKQLHEMVASIPEANKAMEAARSNFTTANVFGFIGGFLVGWPLGTAIAGGDPEWGLAGIGAGFIVLSIPFSSAYTKHAKHAVNLYNSGPGYTGLPEPELHIGMTSSGMGLRLSY